MLEDGDSGQAEVCSRSAGTSEEGDWEIYGGTISADINTGRATKNVKSGNELMQKL